MYSREKDEEYQAIIKGIDNSVALSNHYGDLSDHVDCSALANSEGDYQKAIDSAKMILDSWKDYYPELIKDEEKV